MVTQSAQVEPRTKVNTFKSPVTPVKQLPTGKISPTATSGSVPGMTVQGHTVSATFKDMLNDFEKAAANKEVDLERRSGEILEKMAVQELIGLAPEQLYELMAYVKQNPEILGAYTAFSLGAKAMLAHKILPILKNLVRR